MHQVGLLFVREFAGFLYIRVSVTCESWRLIIAQASVRVHSEAL